MLHVDFCSAEARSSVHRASCRISKLVLRVPLVSAHQSAQGAGADCSRSTGTAASTRSSCASSKSGRTSQRPGPRGCFRRCLVSPNEMYLWCYTAFQAVSLIIYSILAHDVDLHPLSQYTYMYVD